MLSAGACFLLSSSPSLSPFSIRFLLRLLSEWDLRLPRALHPSDLAPLLNCPEWEIKMALRELEHVGLLEDVGHLHFKRGRPSGGRGEKLRARPIYRLRKGMYLEKKEWEEWLRATPPSCTPAAASTS